VIYYPQILAPYASHLRALDAAPAVRRAIDALLERAPQEAADQLSALVAAGSRDAHAYAVLGFIAYRGSRGELAMQLLESALALDPADAHARALLATCYLGLERYADAIEGLREALRRDPALHAAHLLLWIAANGAGRLEAATEALKRALLAEASPAETGPGPKPTIEDTTLCVVDCSSYALAERALRLSMAGCDFEQVEFLSDRACSLPGVKSVPIAPLRTVEDYSRFVLKELVRYVETGHVLLVQWDGYVVNPAAWSPEFLLYDYVGARWAHAFERREAHHNVGNGGFSLRSRALLEALQDPAIEPGHPEDQAIGRRYRTYLEERHGMAFAPEAVADRFSFEYIEPAALPFGFHGVSNLARFLPGPGWATMDYFFGA
jgi:tetratricopeptide (TPR) repeat protein